MPSFSLQQKPPAWYTANPLRGSGTKGTFVDEDFLTALCISKSAYQEMRITCIRILSGQVEDPGLKIDLRSIWKKRDGGEAKEIMLQELISAHPEIFGNTCRLQHVPANWDTVRKTLAELCMISANAFRTRQLQRTNSANESPASSTSISMTQDLPQVPPNGPHFVPMVLDNVVVPVLYGDRRVDVLPCQFRMSAEKPQLVSNVSLDLLLSVLEKKFDIEGRVWGMNSLRCFVELEDDLDLRIALISFLLYAWPGRQYSPGLEVRPLPLSASP
jgi:hypothetical protein